MLAANDNFRPDDPVRLSTIASIAFPHGGMTAGGLRREAARGRLVIMRIANKDFTTLSAIEEMKKKCRVPANQPACGLDLPVTIEKPFGSSSTVESSTARAAANLLVERLRKRSPNTSSLDS